MTEPAERICRCAHPEVLDDTAECRWPDGTEVTWYLEPAPAAAFAPPGGATAVAMGIGEWPRVCGVATRQVSDPAGARVLIRFAPIDGPWNVLGQTELPCDGDATARHLMTLDSGEAWTSVWLAQVVMHEFGHALGLGHAPAPIVAVMSPIYNPGLAVPQPWDVGQAVERYGPPVPQSPAPDPTPEAVPSPPVTFESGFTIAAAGPNSLVFEPVRVDFPEAGEYTVLVQVTKAT